MIQLIRILCFVILAVSTFGSCKKENSLEMVTLPGFYDSTSILYYVDNKIGNDNNTGKDITVPWKTIQKAANSASPGSTVFIRRGIYYENIIMNVTGNEIHPITFTNYMNDSVIIDGTNSHENILLEITNKSYLNFKGLVFQNLTKNNAQGISITATANGKVAGLSFNNIRIRNINWNNNSTIIPSDNNNSQPFIVYGKGSELSNSVTDLIINNCEFTNNITGFSEVVSLDGNISNFIITNNYVHHNTNIGIAIIGNYGTSSNTQLDNARNGLIVQNVCNNNVSLYATSGGIYVDGGKDLKIERNTSFENGYGIEVGNERNGTASNIVVVSNIIYNNENAGLAIGGYDDKTSGQVLNCKFYNNTLYRNNTNNDGSGEIYITKASNCSIQNNIIVTNLQNILYTLVPILPQSDNSLDFNCWNIPSTIESNAKINWLNKVYNGYNNYISSTMQDKKSIFSNPLFNQVKYPYPQFSVSNISPCVNKGNIGILSDLKQLDFLGLPLIENGMVSMGAYHR